MQRNTQGETPGRDVDARWTIMLPRNIIAVYNRTFSNPLRAGRCITVKSNKHYIIILFCSFCSRAFTSTCFECLVKKRKKMGDWAPSVRVATHTQFDHIEYELSWVECIQFDRLDLRENDWLRGLRVSCMFDRKIEPMRMGDIRHMTHNWELNPPRPKTWLGRKK